MTSDLALLLFMVALFLIVGVAIVREARRDKRDDDDGEDGL